MKLFEIAQSYIGYRVVGYDGTYFFSLATQETISLKIGERNSDPKGFFLGTTAQFAMDYYTGLSDYDDALLEYEYRPADVLRGNPDEQDSEIVVANGKLLKINHI